MVGLPSGVQRLHADTAAGVVHRLGNDTVLAGFIFVGQLAHAGAEDARFRGADAERFKPAAVVDIATLTGACVVALGAVRCGLFAADGRMVAMVKGRGRYASNDLLKK